MTAPVDTRRFSGFAKLYGDARPEPPKQARDVVLQYLRKARSEFTVDLGSGTGLSSAIWRDHSDRVVGIEPTPDMIREARLNYPDLEFIEASGYQTTLPSGSAEVVTCSQSFHWMEPASTIAEVDRVLVKNGVFSVYDCVFPVSWDWEAELAYAGLFRKVAAILKGHPDRYDSVAYYPKSAHRRNIEDSRRFRYVTEAMFDHVEDCDAARFIDLALSQGQLQRLMKEGDREIEGPFEEFRKICLTSNQTRMRVCYQMILAVK